jgi:hypothetical protein
LDELYFQKTNNHKKTLVTIVARVLSFIISGKL